MARTRFATYRVNLSTQRRGDGDLPGFFDMLRYEGARVTGWSRTEQGFSVDLKVEAQFFQPGRWASFGLTPQNVNEDVY